MAETAPPPRHTRLCTTALVTIAFFITCAALYFGREFFVPIAFAVVMAAIFGPVLRLLRRWRIPAAIASALILLALLGGLLGLAWALSMPIQKWARDVPHHLNTAQDKLARLRRPVEQASDVAARVQRATMGTTQPSTRESTALKPADPSGEMFSGFIGITRSFVAQSVEALLLLYLLLATGDLFLQKLLKVLRYPSDQMAAIETSHQVERAVLRYLLVTLLINLGQAALVTLVMWWLGMPGAILWGVFTVVLEFIPYLGAMFMILMLSVTAFATFQGVGHILAVPGSYLLITTIQNNVVSPYAYGNGLRLNPVAVLVGVMFWWFLWGIPGAFIAVPLIAAMKIICDHVQTLKPVGEFLGE
jgi:predicted PurR-regulated permease PerM